MPPYHVHPIFVHYPIALLMAGAFFEWVMPLVFRAQKERWQWVGASLLWAGTISAGAAIATGLWAESTAPVVVSAYATVEWHERLGIATGILALILSVWRAIWRPPARPKALFLYGLVWLVLIAAVSVAAYFGGQLVYEYGVGVDAANSVTTAPAS